MTTVHIFDIDTTIANNNHRAELLRRTCVVCLSPKGSSHRAPCPTCGKETVSKTSQEDWDTFFNPDLVIKDSVHPKALIYANKLRARGATVHFLTGRSESLREVTELWLKTKFNRQDGEDLIMRPVNEDGLVASQFKERALRRLMKAKGYGQDTLFFFYEDDPHVLHMYGTHGVVVQCPDAWDYLVPDKALDSEMPFACL